GRGGRGGDRAEVEEVQGLDDEPRRRVILERQRCAHDGGGVERGVLAKGDRDGGELGAGRAIEREVALDRQRRPRRGRRQAIHGVLLVGPTFLPPPLPVAPPTSP